MRAVGGAIGDSNALGVYAIVEQWVKAQAGLVELQSAQVGYFNPGMLNPIAYDFSANVQMHKGSIDRVAINGNGFAKPADSPGGFIRSFYKALFSRGNGSVGPGRSGASAAAFYALYVQVLVACVGELKAVNGKMLIFLNLTIVVHAVDKFDSGTRFIKLNLGLYPKGEKEAGQEGENRACAHIYTKVQN